MSTSKPIEVARAALARAAWTRGDAPDYSETAVADLLADIRHFCAHFGFDFSECDRRAGTYFADEAGSAL